MKIKLGVVFGGETVEHEVSIISAVQAMKHINQEKYEIIPIYIAKDQTWYAGAMLKEIDVYRDLDLLKRYAKKVVLVKKENRFILQNVSGIFRKEITEIDVVLPIVHGHGVEDGSLQGYFETLKIPYVGSNVLGSALGQDKVVMKQVMAAENIPCVPYIWFYDAEYQNERENIVKKINKLGYPVVVKPATLGSSVGISFVKSEPELEEAINEATNYDSKIIVEKAVQNLVEVNASVIGNYEFQEVSVLEEVMGVDEFLSYRDKYLGGGKVKGASKGMASTNRIVPARIDEKLTAKVQDYAKQVFKALNLSGVCRIDFLIDKKANDIYVNEPNTIPGSLSYYLWDKTNKSYEELLDEIITLSLRRYKQESKKTRSFESNILSNYQGVKGVKGLKGLK
ncbi:MAG: D-alanine--D-alanine ligase [Bacilli bacterium]|nr:D-alanine--D-alanine ligase [Bacilli bacterium]